ncbi:uncharacterized protein [Chelonus insularis]|uniref:uncharacterized protein n=1 Tax=Chelonus insularis TaxID=460826 RepID=UPI00158A357F|nr:uncharacterized protein LOC118068961 [Chelonus insularis]
MKNRTKTQFQLSSNVIEEIHEYTKKSDDKPCPTFILKVKDFEIEKDRYWLILQEKGGKEIWAMFSVFLTEKLGVKSNYMFNPVIKLKHYYLHQFEAKDFVENPSETYINVLGINDIEIFNGFVFKHPWKKITDQYNVEQLQILSYQKRKKRRCEPELESTDESDDDSVINKRKITENKPEPKTELNSIVTVTESIQPLGNKNQNLNQVLADKRNNKPIAENTVQPSEKNSTDVRNDTSQAKENVSQPLKNDSPNIQTTSVEPEAFVGNGKTAAPIASLTLTKSSPLIRGCVNICGAITVSARGCSYRRCRLKDSSGEISCVIFEPICTDINNFIKIGAIVEIENGTVDELPVTMLSGNEKYKLNFRLASNVALYLDNKCVYKHPPIMPSIITSSIITSSSREKYKSLQNIKSSVRSGERVDAIGVLIWMSQLIDVYSNNKRAKCRNIRIKDESGSVLVSLWENVAENVKFPIGSIISAKCARLKMIRDDIELVIDFRARISLAEDCEEKNRLQKWYQPVGKK